MSKGKYRGGKRSARSQPLVPTCVPVPQVLSPRRPSVTSESRGLVSCCLMLSFFVEESRAGEPRHPELFSSTSLNSAPRSEWQVAGRRGRALGVRLQRRGARLWLPGRTAQPAAAAAPRGPSHLLGPPPHPGSAPPPVAGSREGGRSTGWLCAREGVAAG